MSKLNLTLLVMTLAKANCFSTHFLMNPAVSVGYYKNVGKIPINHDRSLPSNNAAAAFCSSVASRCKSQTFTSSSPSSIFASMHPSEHDHSYFNDENKNMMNIINAEIELPIEDMKNNKHHHKTTTNAIQGVHPTINKVWSNMKSTLHNPSHKALSLFTAAVIMLSVMFTPLSAALAAPSGGRMGGSFGGSSRGSSSRQSYSRSYSSPSRSYSPPSSSYNRGFSHGYSSGYYSRPSIIVAPSPYSYGYGSSGATVYRRDPGAGVVIFAFLCIVFFTAFSNDNGGGGTLLTGGDDARTMSALGSGVSVAQISVALHVPKKDSPSSILTYLNNLSRTARTDSRVGVSNLVSQVALELLRQRLNVFAANTQYTHYRSGEKATRDFSNLAITERSKFERESINKYGGVDYNARQKTDNYLQTGDKFSPQATAAVVTIILAIDGDSTRLPVINTVSDLQKALTQIASDVKVDDCLRSAEVLWTPQDPNDTLSEKDVIADYPDLRTLF